MCEKESEGKYQPWNIVLEELVQCYRFSLFKCYTIQTDT